VFLDEVGLGERLAHARREFQPLTGCAGREASPGEHGPGVIDVLAEVRFRVRRRIGGDHVEPAGQVVGGPAGADYPGADNGNAAYRFVDGHIDSSSPGGIRERLSRPALPTEAFSSLSDLN